MELVIEVSSDLSSVSYRFGSVSVSSNDFRLVSDFFFLQTQATPGAIIGSRLRFGDRRLVFDGISIANVNEAEVWGPSIDTFILLDTVRSHLAAASKVRLALDVGCGTGVLALWIAKHNYADRVCGIDINTDAIASARLNASAVGIKERAEFLEQPLASFEADERYSLVVCNPPYLPESFHATDYKQALNGPHVLLDFLRSYDSWLADDGKCFASLSAIARLDAAVDRELRKLEDAGRARCVRRQAVPFFIETILCDADRVKGLLSCGGIEQRNHQISPEFWHQLQVWELR